MPGPVCIQTRLAPRRSGRALASETRIDINTPYHELDGPLRIQNKISPRVDEEDDKVGGKCCLVCSVEFDHFCRAATDNPTSRALREPRIHFPADFSRRKADRLPEGRHEPCDADLGSRSCREK